MHECILRLIHPHKYQELLQAENGETPDATLAAKLLKQAEFHEAQQTGFPMATVFVRASATDASYNYAQQIINIPVLRGSYESSPNLHKFSGIDYVWQWAHEHAHHTQSNRQNKSSNFTMVCISRALYYNPSQLPEWLRKIFPPSINSKYASNYNELLAHADSAKCLTKAYRELRKRYDFTIEDRDVLLPSYQQRLTELQDYLSKFQLMAINEFNFKELKQYAPDEIVCLDMTANDVQTFLRTKGNALYLNAMKDLQHAVHELAQTTKEMQIEVGERREETKEYQQELTMKHQNQQKAACYNQTHAIQNDVFCTIQDVPDDETQPQCTPLVYNSNEIEER